MVNIAHLRCSCHLTSCPSFLVIRLDTGGLACILNTTEPHAWDVDACLGAHMRDGSFELRAFLGICLARCRLTTSVCMWAIMADSCPCANLLAYPSILTFPAINSKP